MRTAATLHPGQSGANFFQSHEGEKYCLVAPGALLDRTEKTQHTRKHTNLRVRFRFKHNFHALTRSGTSPSPHVLTWEFLVITVPRPIVLLVPTSYKLCSHSPFMRLHVKLCPLASVHQRILSHQHN